MGSRMCPSAGVPGRGRFSGARSMKAEAVLEAKHAIKQYSVEDLGKGAKMKRCLDAAKKRRWEVLDRLARLGQGLSPAQRNGFSWFKGAWDARMLEEHGDIWPQTFMGWMQRLLGGNEAGVGNVFSVFVHNEMLRCFDGAPALRVPYTFHGRSGGDEFWTVVRP